jgi:hypothetical protein
MMIAVAIVAVGMGTIAGLARRRDSYLNQAARHRRLSNNALLQSTLVTSLHHFVLSKPELELMKAHERFAIHHAELQAKYERAARHPWLPVEPDPPPPD